MTEMTSTPAPQVPAPKPAAGPEPKRRRSHPSLSRRNLIGLWLTLAIGVVNLPSAVLPAAPEGEEGPPFGVLLLGSICGLVMIAAVVVALRSGSRRAVRLAAGVNILQALSAVPAFFVDVPAGIKVLVSVVVVLTFTSVVLSLSPGRRAAAVTD